MLDNYRLYGTESVVIVCQSNFHEREWGSRKQKDATIAELLDMIRPSGLIWAQKRTVLSSIRL